jgi:dihydrofolate reductase
VVVSFIVAMTHEGLIGNDSGLPWHLPADLKRFRKLTMGKPILMGRKTHESIGRPLDGRHNIVLTHDLSYRAESCEVARSLTEALSMAEQHLAEDTGEEVMVIGGGVVFREALPYCRRVYLTIVEGQFEGSVYFPVEVLKTPDWVKAHEESCAADFKNRYPHRFEILERTV